MTRTFHPFLTLLLLCAISTSTALPGNILPERGKDRLLQYGREALSTMSVLNIALRPGYEDLSALAYYRLEKGARVATVYLTNGESGESEIQSEYPSHLAAVLREEATRAMDGLDGEAFFLCLPDGIFSDANALQSVWVPDSVEYLLRNALTRFKPDVVIISGDKETGNSGVLHQTAEEFVLHSAEQLRKTGGWKVRSILAESPDGKFHIPVGKKDAVLHETFGDIGARLGENYATQAHQRASWNGTAPAYSVILPAGKTWTSPRDSGADIPVLASARSIYEKIKKIVIRSHSPAAKRKGYLKELAGVIQEVDQKIGGISDAASPAKRVLLQWKSSLENLKLLELGVDVHYTLSESILVPLQLTFFSIDSAQGIPPAGTTEIYIPNVERGWVLDEEATPRVPFEVNKKYRLIAPREARFQLPAGENSIRQFSNFSPLFVYVIHESAAAESTFAFRIPLRIQFAPRFTAEVLTPIVRAIDGERVDVLLTNHSRDGVTDHVFAADSTVQSDSIKIRLPGKESTGKAVLTLNWKKGIPEGTSLIPLNYGGLPVARFAARNFPLAMVPGKRIGLISGMPDGPTARALRETGAKFSVLTANASVEELKRCDVVIVDRRAMTLISGFAAFEEKVKEFASKGGHLIVLAQDEQQWNERPLLAGLHLDRSDAFGGDANVVADTSQRLLTHPNLISDTEFSLWITRKAFHRITLDRPAGFDIPLRAGREETPVVVSQRTGEGRITYVDLAMSYQWMNINPSAFKLLANLLGY